MEEVRADTSTRLQFFKSFNGQWFFPEKILSSNDILQLFIDSSGNSWLGLWGIFSKFLGPVEVARVVERPSNYKRRVLFVI